MEIPESQWGIIWEGIDHWRGANHLGLQHFSFLIAGVRGAYTTDRIVKGIQDGSEQITPELLHACVRVFGLVSARKGGLDDSLTDEECIELITAPVKRNTGQGQFQL